MWYLFPWKKALYIPVSISCWHSSQYLFTLRINTTYKLCNIYCFFVMRALFRWDLLFLLLILGLDCWSCSCERGGWRAEVVFFLMKAKFFIRWLDTFLAQKNLSQLLYLATVVWFKANLLRKTSPLIFSSFT